MLAISTEAARNYSSTLKENQTIRVVPGEYLFVFVTMLAANTSFAFLLS